MSHKPIPSFSDGHPLMDDLQAYLDQELDPGLIVEFKEHLDCCPSCQAEISSLENLSARLQALPEIASRSDFSEKVLSKIQANKQIPKGLSWTLLVEGIAAGVVLGLFIPAIQTSVWTIRLLDIQFELRAAVNIFLTQIASNGIFWWAKLQLDFTQIADSLNTFILLPRGLPSPWILTLVGAATGLIMNFILLRISFQFKKNGVND